MKSCPKKCILEQAKWHALTGTVVQIGEYRFNYSVSHGLIEHANFTHRLAVWSIKCEFIKPHCAILSIWMINEKNSLQPMRSLDQAK